MRWNSGCYAGVYKDQEIVNKSSSGGAFTAIVNACCDENSIIFGSIFKDKVKVQHAFVSNKNDINAFRKSKYVQSVIGNSFIHAKKFLIENKTVLFTGTPCQIAGLRSFLGKSYGNLITIDILCHGVSNQKIFNQYLLSKSKKGNNCKYSFRNKYNHDVPGTLIIYNKNKKKKYYSYQDTYMKGYSNSLFNSDFRQGV